MQDGILSIHESVYTFKKPENQKCSNNKKKSVQHLKWVIILKHPKFIGWDVEQSDNDDKENSPVARPEAIAVPRSTMKNKAVDLRKEQRCTSGPRGSREHIGKEQ